jgi:hypothetical protein
VWLQSMSLPMLAQALEPYLPSTQPPTANGSLQAAGVEAAVKGLGNLL